MEVNRKVKTLAELFNATQLIAHPEITPVLRGEFRMQGPVGDLNCDDQTDTISSISGRRFIQLSLLDKPHMMPESGICNVCSAPCSSCMHVSRSLMASKSDESSVGACRENSDGQFSINKSDSLPPVSGERDDAQHAVSESSNILSATSSHDPFPVNAARNIKLKSSVASEDVESSVGACRENSDGQFSINKSDSLPPVSGERDDAQHAVSESSNILSATSSHDPFPVNAARNIKLKSSVASEDVEVDTALSSGGTAELDQFSSRSCQVSDTREHSDKLDSRRHTEGHDDNISCAGGGNANCDNTGTSDRHIEENRTLSLEVVSNIAPDGSEKGIHVHTANLGFSLDVEESDNTHRRGIERDIAQKSPSRSAEVSLQAEPLNQGKMIEKVTQKVFEGNCDTVMTFVLESEVGGEKARDLPDECLQYSRQTGEDEMSAEPIEFQEPPSQSPSEEESDGSDVEHDVKVCDICGDAGREDLLATCSRCIDGAEHTYCMRVRLDKVPEGEWFCEECKLAAEAEQKKQDKGSNEFENEKSQSSDQVCSGDTDLSVKLDSNDSDVSAKRRRQFSLGTQFPRKRELGVIEIGREVRRKVAETNKDSPKSASPSRTSFYRESSFKKMDKDRMKSGLTSPPGTPRFQAPKGALIKSNSFGAMSMKPRVKPVDDIPPKQKRTRELGSMDTKDGPPRMLSKSMSLKPSLVRTSTTEAKVKMLSPRSSHVQDMKPLKPIKERSTFDRKNSLKADRPGVASATGGSSLTAPKFDQKLTSRENTSLTSGSNSRDLKSSHSDEKYAFPKSFGHAIRKGSDILGESKWSTAASTTSSSDVRNPAEHKPVQLSPKDESGTNSLSTAEKSSNSSNTILQDNSRPPTDVSTGRSLKEEMSKGNELKAAIQAAMLKKPGICKKNRLADTEPSDELSMTSTDLGNGVAVQEQLSVPNLVRNTVSADRKYAVHSSTSDSCKENNVNSARRITTSSGEFFSYNDGNRFTADRKFNMRGLPVHPMSALLKMSAIPEHEYVWQGDFEVSRSGKVLEVCYGVQAHMSSLASPKVSEVVKKFQPRVSLTEVPRLSTWPAQFHTHGATEDNIALYFFARDLESYERNYKSIVETLMKGDLALKGNVDGVELLIFPSNQLPENSQRWNMLFFLWAVFRTRKVSCQDPVSGSSREVDLPSSLMKTHDKNIPTAVLPSSEDRCLHRTTDNESSDCNRLIHVVPECNSLESSTPSVVSASKTTNGDSYSRQSSTDKTCSVTQVKSKLLDSTLDSHTLPRNSMDSAVPYEKQDSIDSSVVKKKQNGVPDSKSYVMDEVPALGCMTKDTVQKLPMDQDLLNHGQRPPVAGSVKTEKDIANGNITSVKKERNLKQEDGLDLKISSDVVDSLIQDMPVKQSADCQSIIRKRPHLDLVEPPFEAPSSTTSQSTPWNNVNSLSVGGENISKKPKMDPCVSQKRKSIAVNNPDSQIHDIDTTYSAEEKPDLNCDIVDSQISRGVAVNDPESQMRDVSFCAAEKPDLNRDIVDISEAADTERFFFPVVSRPVKDLTCTPWRPVSSDSIHDQPNGWFHKDIPNLELALGAEAKSRGQVILYGKKVVDDRMNQEKLPDVAGSKNIKEEDISATLSLSLAFPFSDNDKTTVKPPSKTEPLLQERRGASGSLLLFGGFADK